MDESKQESAAAAMRQINQAWLNGRVEDLAPLVHLDIVTVFPDFAGKIQGREVFLAGFHDFCQSATIQKFQAPRNFQHHQHFRRQLCMGLTCLSSALSVGGRCLS